MLTRRSFKSFHWIAADKIEDEPGYGKNTQVAGFLAYCAPVDEGYE